MTASVFDVWLARWKLSADGVALSTHSSDLLPVRHAGRPAMLKIARSDEERRGAQVLAYWRGEGAARVFARDDNALLMERASGPLSLAWMARNGRDEEATRILCAVAARLHAPRSGEWPASLIPLQAWFAPLAPIALAHGGVLTEAASAARNLLTAPRDVVVLHGDLHHDNVLDGASRGWLAIDPKSLCGERGFDFANLLRNPDPAWALAPGRFARQVNVICEGAGLARLRLLQWVLAFCGLSAAWAIAEGGKPDSDLAIAERAAAEWKAA